MTVRPVERRAPAPRVRIDPRIRQRRIEVRRAEGRRRLRLLLATLGGLATVGAGLGATRTPLLDVDHVVLRGLQRTPRADVLAASGLDRRPLMTEVDAGALSRQIETLPWVLDAKAGRRWPSTVQIQVRERTPAAVAAAEGGRWAVLDGTGRVLAVEPVRPPGLPALAGRSTAARPGTAAGPDLSVPLRVAAALPPPLRSSVAEVVTAGDDQVELRLSRPGSVVRLGPPHSLEAKLTAALTVIQKADVTTLRVLDVRAPESPVLTRR